MVQLSAAEQAKAAARRLRVETGTDVNSRLRDFEISHQVRLLRASNREGRALVDILGGADRDLADLIRRTRGPSTALRARRLREQLQTILAGQNTRLRRSFSSFLTDVASLEQDVQAEALRRATGVDVGFEFARIPRAQVMAAVRARPFEGDVLANWVRSFERSDRDRVLRQVQQGFLVGQTNEEIVRAVVGSGGLRFRDGTREASRRAIRSLVRTSTIHTATTAREELFRENADVVSGVTWIATLDGRTCPVCGSLDGRSFPLGEGLRPPAHHNCRCVTTPVVKGLEDLPRSLTRASNAGPGDFTGQVPATTTYQEWLRARPPAFQDEVLGKTKGRLFREGNLSLDRFVNDQGKELTVGQLRARAPSAFEAAGLGGSPKTLPGDLSDAELLDADLLAPTGTRPKGRGRPPLGTLAEDLNERTDALGQRRRGLITEENENYLEDEPSLFGSADLGEIKLLKRDQIAELAQRSGLTAGEVRALQRYKGDGFIPMNNQLRTGQTGVERVGFNLKRSIRDVDSAIAKSTLPADATIWRGMRGDADFIDQFQPGFVFEDKGYGSWTLDNDFARSFSERRAPSQVEVMFRMRSQSGDPGVFMGIEEAEVLLPRGMKYRVVEVEDDVVVKGIIGSESAQKRRVVTLEPEFPDQGE